MGDRTSVSLSFPTALLEKAKSLDTSEDFDDPNWENDGITNFYFYEVNYGNLDFLDDFIKAGIAFDSHWDAGGDYGPGTRSVRFTPEGDLIDKEIYDEGVNPDIDTLMELLETPDQLIQYIKDWKEKVSVPDLDEYQVEYGKIYQAKKLISA